MSSSLTDKEREKLISDARFRESKEGIVALVGNLPTMRLILAWHTVTINFVKPESMHGIALMSDAKRLWLGAELDYDEIAAVARIPRTLVEDHVFEAQMHSWIYPDGTVNKYAKKLANVTVVELAKTQPRKEQ